MLYFLKWFLTVALYPAFSKIILDKALYVTKCLRLSTPTLRTRLIRLEIIATIRSSRTEVFCKKKLFLEILQNSQENAPVPVSLLC